MSAKMNVLGAAVAVEGLPSAAQISTPVKGSWINVAGWEGLGLAVLDAALGTAATTTLDVKLETNDSDDIADDAASEDLGVAFTQVTNAVGAGLQAVAFKVDGAKKFVRFYAAAGGVSPSFQRSAMLLGFPKYSS